MDRSAAETTEESTARQLVGEAVVRRGRCLASCSAGTRVSGGAVCWDYALSAARTAARRAS
jgi:hypothetical protein